MKKRLDQFLVMEGLAPSKTKAQELIRQGWVEIFRDGVWKVAELMGPQSFEQVRVQENNLLQFVSRGGHKLAGALSHICLDVQHFKVVDCGQSTGGFTDCLLQCGASEVIGFDVGHGQLHQRLANDSRVQWIENMHFRDFPWSQTKADLIVSDLSFVSSLQACLFGLLPNARKLWL